MSLKKLVNKYIESTENILENVKYTRKSVNINKENIDKVVDYVKAYLEDAKYYRSIKKFEISLTAISYSEGLLDALKLIGAINYT
jgi:hypothetical protein